MVNGLGLFSPFTILKTIPVIDVFAGPGGLGEGFASYSDNRVKYDVRLSFEMDPVACSTLRLRKFFHLSEGTDARNAYYQYLRGQLSEADLNLRYRPLWGEAADRVENVELGSPKARLSVHRRIREELAGQQGVLIGGPPCQAYSIIGRSRSLGIGASPTDSNRSRTRQKKRTKFYSDPRHRLYREYLEIIALHRPLVFVMENVKGLSSARTGADDLKGQMFETIRSDLENPADALSSHLSVQLLQEFGEPIPTRYKLVSLVPSQGSLLGAPQSAADFVVRSEAYGVPQARHRIIIIGIRADINADIPALLPGDIIPARKVLAGMPPLRSSVSRDRVGWLEAINANLWRIPDQVQHELEFSTLLPKLRVAADKLDTGACWQSAGVLSVVPLQLKCRFERVQEFWRAMESIDRFLRVLSQVRMGAQESRTIHLRTEHCHTAGGDALIGRTPSQTDHRLNLRSNQESDATEFLALRARFHLCWIVQNSTSSSRSHLYGS